MTNKQGIREHKKQLKQTRTALWQCTDHRSKFHPSVSNNEKQDKYQPWRRAHAAPQIKDSRLVHVHFTSILNMIHKLQKGQLLLHDPVLPQILSKICFFFLFDKWKKKKRDKTKKDEQLLTKVNDLQLTQEISVSLSSRDNKHKANVFCYTNRTRSQNLSSAWFWIHGEPRESLSPRSKKF